VKEGLIFTGADVCPHQLRVGCQDTSALFIQVHPRHGRHIVNVIIIPGNKKMEDSCFKGSTDVVCFCKFVVYLSFKNTSEVSDLFCPREKCTNPYKNGNEV
jgi:hypothetical protein